MKNFKWRPALGLVVAVSMALVGCSKSGSSNGNASVRLLNATLTHPSLDLLVNSAAALTAVTTDTVSTYVTPSAGSVVLQINDNGQSTALTTISPTIGSGAHVTIVAYEVNGVIKTTVLPEDAVLPASGASALRVLDSATDAGAIDVYVAAPVAAGSIPVLTSPNFSFGAQNYVQLLPDAGLPFTPGTYEIVVTGQGNPADIRADIKNVVLTSTQLGLIVLTPASGGALLNGGALVEQTAGYVSGRNTNARVRLVSGVAGGAAVAATAAATSAVLPVGSGNSPFVGTYTLIPATAPVSVTIGTGVAVTVGALPAGSDNTLLVTGTSASPVINRLTDDNHLPTSSTSLKVRLVNGLSGTNAAPLSLAFNFSTFAGGANVAPGAASTYGVQTIPTSVSTEIDVTSTLGGTVFTKTGLGLSANAVYTVFLLGDYTAPALPFATLSQDR